MKEENEVSAGSIRDWEKHPVTKLFFMHVANEMSERIEKTLDYARDGVALSASLEVGYVDAYRSLTGIIDDMIEDTKEGI